MTILEENNTLQNIKLQRTINLNYHKIQYLYNQEIKMQKQMMLQEKNMFPLKKKKNINKDFIVKYVIICVKIQLVGLII